MTAPRFSVIIPTHQRRELVSDAVRSLHRQVEAPAFEIVVVVDGSTDGTAEALAQLDRPVPTRIVHQAHLGAAAARNHGARAALGEILLFLDDDMEARHDLLREHERSHREGADVVIGHIPLHPASSGFLAEAVGFWSDARRRALTGADAQPTYYDLLTGQLSIRRQTFDGLYGFDERFTKDGSFGGEDLDLGQRIIDSGCRVVFNPAAISAQRYVVTPAAHLRQWRDAGRADVVLVRKHPRLHGTVFGRQGLDRRRSRVLWRLVVDVPFVGMILSGVARRPVLRLVRDAEFRPTLFRLFRWVRTIEYWRGVRDSGGIPRPRRAFVLAYHAVADLSDDPVLGAYGVPADLLRQQLGVLARAGYRWLEPDEIVRLVRREAGVPRRSVLITFDDAHESLLNDGVPVLEGFGAPAVVFAVSGEVGGTNRWDQRIGAKPVPLLTVEELRSLSRRGVEVGAHSRTHPVLTDLTEGELDAEVRGSLDDLATIGVPRPRLFAYPYGAHDPRVRSAVARADVAAAFTTTPGAARAGSDRLAIPRIEVRAGDSPSRLRLRLALRAIATGRFPWRG